MGYSSFVARTTVGDSLKQLLRQPARAAFVLAAISLIGTTVRAGLNPPPDGGYPGQNTAVGALALDNMPASSYGQNNTAIGYSALQNTTTGESNTALGSEALNFNTTGVSNTAAGAGALRGSPDLGVGNYNTATGHGALFSNIGDLNTAAGFNALASNSSGSSNAALGADALSLNTTGSGNTANGMLSLYNNTTGSLNTASGFQALYSNTIGYDNVAHGVSTLYSNTTGHHNSANGWSSLLLNTSGNENTASGAAALQSNTIGNDNTASGYRALYSNTTGTNNLANGANTLSSNTTGFFNIANGGSAMFHNTTGSYNTADGISALYNNTTGTNNIALGALAGADLTIGNNNIDIGNRGIAGETGKIRIGTKGKQTGTYIAGISGVTIAGGVGVIIDTNGHLGTVMSSARFKEQIKSMDQASESIFALRPVTFRYKHQLDPQGLNQFGLIAEEVEKVNPSLVARDESGKVYTVRYEAVNAMLLNEFLKEHCKVEKLEADAAQQQKDFQSAIAQQKEEIGALTKALRAQGAQIQKVSAQLSLQKPATQTASLSVADE
jgi:hypothetical protein